MRRCERSAHDFTSVRKWSGESEEGPLMSESPWFRPVVGIGDNYMGLAPARATQKPGMPRSVLRSSLNHVPSGMTEGDIGR